MLRLGVIDLELNSSEWWLAKEGVQKENATELRPESQRTPILKKRKSRETSILMCMMIH